MSESDKTDRNKGKSKSKNKKKSSCSWALRVFLLAVALSALLSFFSSTALEGTGYAVAIIVLAVFIALGIVFDMIGVAVTAADPKPFHSMAAHKEKGAKEAIRLLKNANQVSSFCNDVVGDICGIVSGSTAAVIVVELQRDLSTTSILISIAVSLVGTIRDAAAEAKETKTGSAAGIAVKKTGLMILEALEAGGKGSITVAVACSMAGMIAGCITVTGLASKLISGVVALSSKIPNPTLSLLLALFLTMLCCIVLGMGVPTTANYCIMASTCAPILITLGIPKIAAHFFVFYFGIVADITPPVALAAYAGSAIAKSDPMKTGINATKLAIAAFIVPYMFAMNPSMLLMDQGVLAAVQVIISSCLGIFGIAAALEGYVVTRAPWWQRILLAAGGLCLIDPRLMTDLVGIAAIVIVVVLQIVFRKRSAAAAA